MATCRICSRKFSFTVTCVRYTIGNFVLWQHLSDIRSKILFYGNMYRIHSPKFSFTAACVGKTVGNIVLWQHVLDIGSEILFYGDVYGYTVGNFVLRHVLP